jgi:hypothetical protein
LKLSRRHVLKQGDQWFSPGWRSEDEDGWVDVESQYWGKTVAAADLKVIWTGFENFTNAIRRCFTTVR